MQRILISLVCIIGFLSVTAAADVVIIAHKDVPETTLSQKDLQEIFLSKRVQWKDNTTIHHVTVREPSLHKAFLRQYLKKSSAKWNAYWKRMVFTGNGTPPKRFDTQKELLEYVANTAGAVGYIDAEIVTENVNIIVVR